MNPAATASTAPARTQERISSDALLPDETLGVRERARAAVESRLEPHAREIARRTESRESFPWEAFRGLADEGMFTLPFPESEGGAGLEYPLLGCCTAVEEIAYQSSSLAGVYDGQCLLVGRSLMQASQELRDEWLPGLISGEKVGCFATTEPEASSDLGGIQTTIEPDGDELVINGRKRWITNSVVGDLLVMLGSTGENGMTMALVPMKDQPGLEVGEPDLKMGHRGQITADINFDGVRIPRANAIGEVGKGLGVALSSLTWGRIGIAAAGVGVAQAAMDLAVARLREREVFGKKLGEMQHWQFKLAERAIELESARSLYQKAALRYDRGATQPEPEASMAKVLGTRLANDLAREALQIHGAIGFAQRVAATGQEARLEELYRDAKILEIFEGANEVLLWVVARQLIGRDVTG